GSGRLGRLLRGRRLPRTVGLPGLLVGRLVLVARHRRDVLGGRRRRLPAVRAARRGAVATTAAAAAGPTGLLVLLLPSGLDRLVGDEQATALAVLAGLAERLEQAGADPLARHLHQAERGHLGHLVPGPVAAQALDEPPPHEVAVALKHHVDEVDDDDPADVAEPELADHLLRGLEV